MNCFLSSEIEYVRIQMAMVIKERLLVKYIFLFFPFLNIYSIIIVLDLRFVKAVSPPCELRILVT